MSEQQLVDLENSIPGLRDAYKQAMTKFIQLKQTRSKKEDRLAAYWTWYEAAIVYFNARDRLIVVGAREKADKTPEWYTDQAESAVNLLETIRLHYQTVYGYQEDLGLNAATLKPSMTAFANLQRIVKETHPDIALQCRDEFKQLHLPTHGFDKEASVKQGEHRLEWRFFLLGMILLAVAIGLALWGFSLKDLSPDQRIILKWSFPLASGFSAWSFSGALSAKGKGWHGFFIAATGGFGVWLISHFLLFNG